MLHFEPAPCLSIVRQSRGKLLATTAGRSADILSSLPVIEGGCCEKSFCQIYGVLKTSSPLPKGLNRGQLGECYLSAGKLALTRPDEFVYCEGWAQSSIGIPLQHAWCLDHRGNVVDPTWPHRQDAQYLGIPIKTTALRDRVLNTQYWGFFTRGIPAAFADSPETFIERQLPNAFFD